MPRLFVHTKDKLDFRRLEKLLSLEDKGRGKSRHKYIWRPSLPGEAAPETPIVHVTHHVDSNCYAERFLGASHMENALSLAQQAGVPYCVDEHLKRNGNGTIVANQDLFRILERVPQLEAKLEHHKLLVAITRFSQGQPTYLTSFSTCVAQEEVNQALRGAAKLVALTYDGMIINPDNKSCLYLGELSGETLARLDEALPFEKH